tara:strand:- start:9790 stop:9984 length:195 start_codon:yes stop_codon:yes gene_type:complete
MPVIFEGVRKMMRVGEDRDEMISHERQVVFSSACSATLLSAKADLDPHGGLELYLHVLEEDQAQ